MSDHRLFLRVKLKALAAEARIIRAEGGRAPVHLREALAYHRRGVVRAAARNTSLAYAFLRGRPYRRVEGKCGEPPNWGEVRRMVRMYGVQGSEDVDARTLEGLKEEEA